MSQHPASHPSPSSDNSSLSSLTQPPPPAHHPAPQNSHPQQATPPFSHASLTSSKNPPLDRDPYHRPLHADDPYYFSQHPHPSPEYRVHRPPLPPPPHPPAPPAPPRSQPHKKPYKQGHTSRPTAASNFNHYRPRAEYDTQNSALPHGGAERTLRQDGTRARSASAGSGYGSGAHEGETEPTPSPVDPLRIQQWEEEHAGARDQSSASSYRPEDDDDTLHAPSLPTHGFYPPSSFEHVDSVGRRGGSGLDPASASLNIPYSQKRPNSEYYPSPHHQAQFHALAQETGSTDAQRGDIGLNSLFDSEPGDRPSYPIPTIIKCAILGSPHQQLTLSELYLAMEMRFDYYRNPDPEKGKKSWRNSVRHNLSLNNQFDKKDRPITEPGKGHYWIVVPDRPQGNKRERKRNKKPGKRALAAMGADGAQGAGSGEDSAGSTFSGPPIDPQLTSAAVTYTAPARAYTTAGTLPANAGSYAAVTGALPVPPPLDRHLLRPWADDPPPLDFTVLSAVRQEIQPGQHASSAQRDHDAPSPAQERRAAEPQFGESSLRAPEFAPSSRHPDTGALEASRLVEPPSTEHTSSGASSTSTSTSQNLQPSTETHGRYDHAGPIPKAPENAFSQLAAEIERDGIGATGSGGPALAAAIKRGRGRDTGDEWDSDGDEPSDDEYLPRKRRRRR